MDSNIDAIERALLVGKWVTRIDQAYTHPMIETATWVVDGHFRAVLTSAAAQKVFCALDDDSTHPFDDLRHYLTNCKDNSKEGELLRLILAVACLHAFVQANWTGPHLDVTPLDVLCHERNPSAVLCHERNPSASISTILETIDHMATLELASGGEPAYHLAKHPAFLRLSQILLSFPFNHLWSASWWNLRATLVHQQILDEPVGSPEDIMDNLQTLPSILKTDAPMLGRLYLEQSMLGHHFSRDKLSSEYLLMAAKVTGIEIELTGALGKRTKFQQTEHSQLVLFAESHLVEEGFTETDKDPGEQGVMPHSLALNDDTLLEETKFTASAITAAHRRLHQTDPSSQPPLHPLDQCILLSLCLSIKNTSPSHGLTTEQMAPYVSRVISHPRNWSVHTMALLIRSRLESTRSRTVERATLQLQALIDQMPTADSPVSERLMYFHSVPLPSKWAMEKELAMLFLSLGVVKSALEIFERLEMWEEVVKCWGTLERPERGVAIVRDLLEGRKAEADAVLARGKVMSPDQRAVKDSARQAKLWCLLGDLEPANAAEHYKRAWDISEGSSGRAIRSLGGYYYARGQYHECISCLKHAVRIHPLLTRSWFILGCAYMRVEEWEEAKNAFTRCVTIDEEDGESWNNLASMYLRLGTNNERVADTESGQPEGDSSVSWNKVPQTVPYENKLLAFRALKEGLRYSYDNWRMWVNFMIVAMDVGELHEACRALTRAVDLTRDKRQKEVVDEDVLDRLVNAVIKTPTDQENARADQDAALSDDGGRGLFRTVANLFERTILPRISTARIFHSYARLLTWQCKWESALKAYVDAYHCGAAGSLERGETDVAKWHEAVEEVGEIVDVLRNIGPRIAGCKWRLQARSIVRTFMARTRDFEDEEAWSRLVVLLEGLQADGGDHAGV